jgi:hypothetical protein
MAAKKTPTREIKRRGDGTITPGSALNPRGRPPGVKELVPRGFVKKLVFGVITGNVEAVAEALRRAAVNPRSVISVLEHAARLNKEIGGREDGRGGTTIINLHTNVNMLALRAAAPRAAKVLEHQPAPQLPPPRSPRRASE